MPDKRALLYIRDDDSYSLDDLEADLKETGLTLYSPVQNVIVYWSNRGNRWEVKRDSLVRRIEKKRHIAVQWWLDSCTDVLLSLKFVTSEKAIIEDYALYGRRDDDMQALVRQFITRRFRKMLACGKALGMMIDGTGATEEYNWNSFFFTSSVFESIPPDVVGLPKSFHDRYKPVGMMGTEEAVGNFKIITHYISILKEETR